MKKFVQVLCVFGMPVLGLNAQVIINSTDFPAIGTVYYDGLDTLPPSTFSVGNNGASQSFDFSQLSNDRSSTLDFLAPDTFSFFNQVPAADIVLTQFGGYAFADIGTNKVELLGYTGDFQGFGIGVSIVYDDPQTILEFPVSFGLSYTDSNAFNSTFKAPAEFATFADSIRIIHTESTSSEIDAWGTITTPLGSFDVLRNKTISNASDEIYIRTFLGWILAPLDQVQPGLTNPIIGNTTLYDYLSKEKGYYVARVTINNENDSIQTVRFLTESTGFFTPQESNIVMVYPNPANDVFNVEYKGQNPGKVLFYDITGVLVKEQLVENGINSIDITSLPVGMYSIKVTSDVGAIFLTSKFSVAR